ncbi:MAG: extracellular solute-binding protein [Acholeplasmataceae bacterium]
MKKILFLGLLVVTALFLVSCGGDRTTDTSAKMVEWYELAADANLDTTQNTTITFWHRMGASSQLLVDQWITEFEAIYPNITVVEEKAAADYTSLSDKIALAIPAGTAPDIAESYPDHIARYASANAPLALNYFISNRSVIPGTDQIMGFTDDEIADFLPGLWAEGQSYDNAGTILSLPFTKSSEAFYYNATYFAEHGYSVPTTWDEVFTIAEDIKSREPEAIPFGYDSEDNLFITGSAQWDAPYTGYNALTGQGEVQFNNDASKEMVKYFKDKLDRGLMITRTLNGEAYSSDTFNTGEKLYMLVGSTGGTRYNVPSYTDAKTSFQVGVAPLPAKDATNRQQIQQGPNINLFNNGDEQRMIAAWLFAKYMVSPEKTAEFSIPSGYAPVRYSAYETTLWTNYLNTIVTNPSTKVEAQNKLVKEAIEIFLNNDDIFFTSAVFNLSSKTRTEVGALLVKILAFKGTQAEIDAYIDEQYQDSYDFITN